MGVQKKLKMVVAAGAPAALGPYSHAVDCGDLLFLSGQISLDPSNGQMVGTTAAEQAAQCLKNMKAVLESQGLGFGAVAKVTLFLTSMADFASVNEVYVKAFGDWKPARSAVAVAALPRGALVEIEAVACR
jgi:2-iminobutanoate/2-iminopropanoate deaminase